MFFEELIIVAGKHTVVKLADLIGFSAVKLFQTFVGCQDIDLPGAERGKMLTHFLIKDFRFFHRSQAFAVGRIADDGATAVARFNGQRVGKEYLDVFFHACLFDTSLRNLDGFGADIGSIGFKRAIGADCVSCFFTGSFPDLLGHPCEFFSREIAEKPGSRIGHEHSGFDRNGGGAAEGVVQKHFFSRSGDFDHGGGKRFAQGRGHILRTVAALMQGCSGCIDHQACFILENEKFNLMFYAVFQKPIRVIYGGKLGCDGFFDDFLAIRNAEQHTFDGMSLYGKFTVFGNEILPRERFRAFEELFERSGAEGSEQNVNVLGGAKPKVASCDGGFIAFKNNSSVYCLEAFITERVDFFPQNSLKTEKTGCNKC